MRKTFQHKSIFEIECRKLLINFNYSSCTANAIVSGLREYLLKQSGRPFVQLSRLFLYYHERRNRRRYSDDKGAILRDGMSVLEKIGVCPEKIIPTVKTIRDKPSSKAENDARLYRIGQYNRVQDLPRLKSALAHGLPVVLGFLVTKSFCIHRSKKTGIVPISGTDDVIIRKRKSGGTRCLCCWI